jgi:hypothetical protein
MGIYRGAGGTGDATNDGYSEASIVRDLAAELQAEIDALNTGNYIEVDDIGVTVQAYDADLTSWAGVATSAKQDTLVSGTNIKTVNSTSLLGSGDVTVQATLVSGTNIKTINSASLLGSGNITTGDVTLTGTETLTNKTLTSPTLTTATTSGKFTFGGAIDETVFAVTGTTPALSPSNGTIQTWTLSGNSTPTQGTWVEGESMTLMINDGSAFTVTWTSVPITWVGGTAPTLATTGFTVIELWEVGTTIYGALVGTVA